MRRLPHVVQGGSPPAGTAPSSPLEPLGNDLKALVGDSAHPPSLHLASGERDGLEAGVQDALSYSGDADTPIAAAPQMACFMRDGVALVHVSLVNPQADWRPLGLALELSPASEVLFDGVAWPVTHQGLTQDAVTAGTSPHDPIKAALPSSGVRTLEDAEGLDLSMKDLNVSFTTPPQRACVYVSLGMALAAWAYVWTWWAHAHTSWALADLYASAVMASSCFDSILDLVMLSRAQRVSPAVTAPRLRVAMVVTRAPSESFPLLQTTLLAMLDQDYPHAYSVWLADEAPTAEVHAWCAKRGVHVSSRFGVDAYHRTDWPRRTRCKEGNLAYFYDHWGYDLFDVVAQFDADHVPARDYLSTCMPAFRNPDVGYVAAPSVCSDLTDACFMGRGRLYDEASMHGPGRACTYPEFVPLCIGSHYAVRTSHLKQVGGIGPELDEDFQTSYMLTAGGFKGAYSIDTAAVGAGPATFEDCVKQDYQWSRSLTIILMRWVRPFWVGDNLAWTEKMRLALGFVFYPKQAACFVLTVALVAAPAFGVELGNASMPALALHLMAPSAVAISHLYWLRRQGWLRPANAPVLSFEGIVQRLVSEVWIVKGVVHGVLGHLFRVNWTIKVTPKGEGGLALMSPFTPLPLALLSATFSALAAYSSLQQHALWLYALLWAVVTWTVLGMHMWENYRVDRVPWASVLQLLAVAALAGGALVAATARDSVASALWAVLALPHGDACPVKPWTWLDVRPFAVAAAAGGVHCCLLQAVALAYRLDMRRVVRTASAALATLTAGLAARRVREGPCTRSKVA